jgi:hypothetical protein
VDDLQANRAMGYAEDLKAEAKFKRDLKEGRGTGRYENYIPWVNVHDFPSKGRAHRVFGTVARRIHHFFSDIEWRLFQHLDRCDDVRDIREQFPLDRNITRRTADRIGARHPLVPRTKTLNVMTTDILVDRLVNGKVEREACFVKPSSELEKPSVQAKLEIERIYWTEQEVHFRIFTEREFSRIVTKNLDWLRPIVPDEDQAADLNSPNGQTAAILDAISRMQHLSLRQFCVAIDKEFGADRGSSRALMRHLLATKAVTTDLAFSA